MPVVASPNPTMLIVSITSAFVCLLVIGNLLIWFLCATQSVFDLLWKGNRCFCLDPEVLNRISILIRLLSSLRSFHLRRRLVWRHCILFCISIESPTMFVEVLQMTTMTFDRLSPIDTKNWEQHVPLHRHRPVNSLMVSSLNPNSILTNDQRERSRTFSILVYSAWTKDKHRR